MRRSGSTLSGFIAMLFAFLLCAPTVAAFTNSYCSPQNTANDAVYTWQYQSNGNCTNHCSQTMGTYAFAVIQYQDCYCSNLIPSQQVDMNRCKKDCPGFGAEDCGSADDGLYIYIKGNGQPSGTAGGPSSSQPTSAIPSPAPPKVVTSVRSAGTITVVQTTIVQQTPVATASNKPSSTPQASRTPDEPQTSKQVVTESGVIITRTIIQTPSSYPTSSTAPVRSDNSDSGPNVGAIAGGVAGGIIGFIALVGGLVFFLWRRRKQQREAQENGNGGDSSGGITRNTSTMSKAGLLGGATAPDHQYPPRIATNFSSQNSRYGPDHESISPISNRRNSQPLMIDSRLNPNAVMTFAGANLSRDSVASLDDSRDYGRQLNVRNPDP